MLNEMLGGVYLACPICGRYHQVPLEYWWCPYCGSDVNQKIKNLEKRIENLEQYLQEEVKEEINN